MKRFSLLLLLFLLTACGGQRRLFQEITNPPFKRQDCKTLFKKQNLQYKLAIREGKANHRRKKSPLTKSNPDGRDYKNDKETGQFAVAHPTEHICILPGIPNLGVVKNGNSGISNSSDFAAYVSAGENTSLKIQPAKKRLEKSRMNQAVFTTFSSSSLPVLFIGMSGLTAMALLKLFQAHAQQLSHWAKKFPWKSRGVISVAQIGMGLSSLSLGDYLYEAGIMIPDYARQSAAGIFAVAAIFYPSTYHPNGSPAFSYLQRKFHDAALFTAGAMLTVYAGNQYNFTVRPAESIQIVESASAPKARAFSVKFASHQISVIKKEFEARLAKKFEDPIKGKTRGEKVALTILVSLGFAFLTVGVAAISCNLSCSGNEAAAIGVLIAGAAIIAWGLSSSLKKIHRAPTIEKKTKVQPSPSNIST